MMCQTAEHGHLSTFPAPALSLRCLQPFNPKHACSATSWHLLVLAPLPGILHLFLSNERDLGKRLSSLLSTPSFHMVPQL